MGNAIERAETLEGVAIQTLRTHSENDEDRARLKRAMRNSGERAIREYVESIGPDDAEQALSLYEDSAVPALMAAALVPMT
jgi:hypothetical protein